MRILGVTLCLLVLSPLAPGQEPALEQIMEHPDWIGNAPERAYWADDGDSIFYSQKVTGEEHRELHEIGLNGRPMRTVVDADRGAVSVSGGDYNASRTRKVYEREGDIYLRDIRSGAIRQLTRTAAHEDDPSFMTNDSLVQFERDDAIFIRNLDSGIEYQAADLRTEDDPQDEDEDEEKDEAQAFLKDQQKRLFEIVRSREEKKDAREERSRAEQSADATRAPLPWYLGKDYEVVGSDLSPRGDRMFVAILNTKDRKKGKAGFMPNYVTDTGYTENKDLRARVGTAKMPSQEFLLLDLATHTKHAIDVSILPGIAEDPLESIRETKDEADEEDASDAEEEDDEPKPRPVTLLHVEWGDDGGRLALDIGSRDNKDRWIATVDLDDASLDVLHHERDEAWINYSNRIPMAWLPGEDTLYFVSESGGYAHVYIWNAGDPDVRQLTRGPWEVTNPVASQDGKHIYFRANVRHPGEYEVYRVALGDGAMERLTDLRGNLTFTLSPNERQLLLRYSSLTAPPELYVQRAQAGAEASRLTDSTSDAFKGFDWVEPQIVQIASRTGRPIYSRVYDANPRTNEARPAVVFIHGAGYLQNAHKGWSGYFREFMFHTLLVNKGYVVLDMDYRASLGYGRDWRTAIYRQMGTPELQDLEDGVGWLANNRRVDPKRVGVYGGSYGGFLTLMGLFTKPELFACGAALRPVTDWASYNHGYTSNILNVPAVDEEAFAKSSPIEFAEGLNKPLLIAHGMQDDNVFYQDSVRLVQRLIELKKENWELASYPIEPHGFREPTSWLDEYRRILKLFETHLK